MAEQAAAGEKLDFKKILPVFVIVLVDLLGLTVIIPLLPLYAASFQADAFTIGALGTAYPLMQLVGGPLLGGLSDRYGRKPVLVISQIGTFIGFVILALAGSLPVLFLSRIIDGLTGGNIVTAQAAITDSTSEKTRAQGLGLIGAAFGLGFTLGPAIAGISLALSGNDYRVPALIAAAFSLLSIFLTSVWFKETLPPEKRGARSATGHKIVGRILNSVRSPLLGALLILVFLQRLVFGGFENLLALFTLSRLGLNAAGNAVLFVFVGIILVLVQGKYIGPWSRRFGEYRLIYVGLGLIALGLLVLSVTPEQPPNGYSRAGLVEELTRSGDETRLAVPIPADTNTGWLGIGWLMASLVPIAVGGGLVTPSLNSLITRRVDSTEVGSALGVSTALVSLATAITPLLGGATFQLLGASAPFLIGGVIMAALVGFALLKVTPLLGERAATGAGA
jgi:MFS transporter, DHA1 family, tetracycline resistance protein